MNAAAPGDPYATHTVFNQAPAFEDVNLFTSDRVLTEGLRREGAGWAEERARAFGEIVGRRETIAWGFQANEHPPVLRTHDRNGNRIDEVEFHPAWHALMALGVEHGLHALPWSEPKAGAHVARAALFMMLAEVEAGVGCPLSMTYSAVPALRLQPELAAEWEPRLTSTAYDPRSAPAAGKRSALCGMAMTEKQGGSDVRANTTAARPIGAGVRAASTRSPATSGSARRRCATPSWCWRRPPRAASPASSFPASRRTARATASTSSG
jgi:putative acyl-CoA dehydrogenase